MWKLQKDYFSKLYLGFDLTQPSLFAQSFAAKYLHKNDTLLELGCGNGRDGAYLSGFVGGYVGLDKSPEAITRARILFNEKKIKSSIYELAVADATDPDSYSKAKVEVNRLIVYSRFFFHSINQEQEDAILKILQSFPSNEIVMLLEVRTIYDDLFGLGEKIAENTFRTDHARRFIVPHEFIARLNDISDIQEYHLAKDFAPFLDSNPVVLRLATRFAR